MGSFTLTVTGASTSTPKTVSQSQALPAFTAQATSLASGPSPKKNADGSITCSLVSGGSVITAILAFVYSIWAIAGSGHETVYWGFLLLLVGIPIYVWMKFRKAKLNPQEIAAP